MSEDRGEGPRGLLFVPGLGLDSREWYGVLRCLNDQTAAATDPASVVLLPSLGQRAPRGTELRVEALAERLANVVQPGAVLVGHSAGCAVAIEIAARSTSVAGLVLVGPATDPRAATWPRLITQLIRTAVHEHWWEAPILLPQYFSTGLGSMARGMNAVRSFRSDRAIARTSVPVAIVHGSRDRIAPYDWCSQLAEAAGGQAFVTSVPGAAHMVPITHPEAIAVAVQAIQARFTQPITNEGAE
ncbi:alpha/beta hydrolase [Kribbella sp. NPDC051952]|uniref:alpha/beta fold hydrolase n=1 Tax=Kribbella sp. NPDC051952 TaxID=3154851 RepID=UPI00344761A7